MVRASGVARFEYGLLSRFFPMSREKKERRSSSPDSRTKELALALRDVEARIDRRARMLRDPVSIVHEHADVAERELVAVLASSLAFGNVTAIVAKLRDALCRIGPDVVAASDDLPTLQRRLRGWVHRVYTGDDVARLLAGARAVQREHGSLGKKLAADLRHHHELRPALAVFVAEIRAKGGLDGSARRGAAHILPDPNGASGCKRLLLFLRWMVRPADGVDLGLWSDLIPREILLVPVDVHLHKIGRNLGLVTRKAVTWQTAEELTARLREIDPVDPVRFDFALCHLGMLQRCPSRRDPVRCDGCPMMPLCVHWKGKGRDKARAPVRSLC